MLSPQKPYRATKTWTTPPEWAVLERQLFGELESAIDLYLKTYTDNDGELIYRDDWQNGRDGLDDLYEAFYALPLLYVLGGHESLLKRAHFHWNAVNRQAARYGLVHNEYEVGYDQFHQSEGNLFFYFLCAADPENPRSVERARRFAGLYMNWDPDAPNYDEKLNIIRAVHTGAKGPRWGYIDGQRVWTSSMEPYGLPFYDVPGIESYDDISADVGKPDFQQNSDRLVAVMNERMGKGDSIANLPVTSLMTNAFLLTGEPAFRDWVETYIGGWWKRAECNGGIVPDNVGLSGKVGEYLDGRWYGAAYGWSWPHGYESVLDAMVVAAQNATLLTGDRSWVELPGQHFDMLLEKGVLLDDRNGKMTSRRNAWVHHYDATSGQTDGYAVPKRYRDAGWFDYHSVDIAAMTSCWAVTMSSDDLSRLAHLEQVEPYDWTRSFPFRSKGDNGHERPWLAYLDGRNPDYPVTILRHSQETVLDRLNKIAADNADLSTVHIHHWQNHSPITTEALIQLTLGAPQGIYHGGFIHASLRYFDPCNRRPGLPDDVAALISSIDEGGAVLQLVNLSKDEERALVIQGGFYGEHRIERIFPCESGPALEVGAPHALIELPAGTEVTLRVTLTRNALQPSYAAPAYGDLCAKTFHG